jgi:predicted RNA-binding protein with PIN domain
VRRLIVDGMNVIGSRPDGWWRDRPGAMRRLAARLAERAAAGGEELVVVFDGREPKPPVEAAGVEVRFAPGGPNAADRLIEALVAASDDPAAITVVTSDRELERRVTELGAEVGGASGFRRELDAAGDA